MPPPWRATSATINLLSQKERGVAMAGFFVFHHGEIFFPYNNITALLFITL
jgi:hypothetical protein